MASEGLFNVITPLGFRVRTTDSYWRLIVTLKHPVMLGQQARVQQALVSPDEVRRSISDASVYLFYRRESEQRWTCVIAKRLNGEGFVVTAYPCDSIKEGESIWTR